MPLTTEQDTQPVDTVEMQVADALQQIQAKEVAVNVGTTTKSASSHPPSHSVHSGTMFDCGCKLANGKPCIEALDKEAVQAMKCDTNGLSHDELDMVILGQIAASHRAAVNKTTFHFNGQRICRSMFLYLHNISRARLTALVTHYSTKGLTPRTHGNTKRLPHNATSYDTIKEIVRFILNLAEEQALVLPGRVPGYHRSDLQLLPSSTSKSAIWLKYCESCSDNRRAVSRKTFCSLWQELVPHVIIMKPMTDLCWECQKNSTLIQRASNTTNEEKSAAIEKALKHIRRAEAERKSYNTITAECKSVIRHMYDINGSFVPPPPNCTIPPCTGPQKAHYSFDYAQQVHYPANPLQPGPIYFLTPRKCSLFGVWCESISRQINYLCDEIVDTGKGSNSVISNLHHFFGNHGLGEKHLYLHADNCAGQNKNNILLRYLAWRVMVGLHKSITLSFLLVGHTKFSPDWCFGLVKRLYRRSQVNCLDDIVKVVESSAHCNVAQLIGNQEGDIIVPSFDWLTFFDPHFRRFKDIKKYHHFYVTQERPGIVSAKEYEDS